jgi:hypothetical protein
MPSLIPDAAAFERRLAGLPIVKHPASHGTDLCFVSRKTYSAACCNAVSDPRARQWAKTDATRNPTVQWPRRAAHYCVGATSVYLNQQPFGLHAAWKKAA